MEKKRLFLKVCFRLTRLLLKLRYRWRLVGFDKIEGLSNKRGIVFLPNHPAEIDPILLMALLGPAFCPRPLIVEHFYKLKGFRWLLDLARVIPIPTMDEKANKWRGRYVARRFEQVRSLLKGGDNFIIYPSGRLKHTGLESIGGASFAHELLQKSPDSQVVLVRTTGLWGSSFSRAITGNSPNFGAVLLQSAKALLKSLIFFLPKREITVEFLLAGEDLPVSSSRIIFNQYLEDWYNRYPEKGPEPLTLVAYSRWNGALPKVVKPKDRATEVRQSVPKEVESAVVAEIARLSKIPKEDVNGGKNLSTDLGLDSLDIAEIYVFLDRRFDIHDLEAGELQTVEDVMQAAVGAKSKKVRKHAPSFTWPKEHERKDPFPPQGATLQEAFLQAARAMGSQVACADALSGCFTYKKLKLAALILADVIRKKEGDKIGIMLPASVAANLVVLAVLLAKKTPVMLNWTVGTKSLDHAAKVSGISHVVTSQAFLDRLENDELGTVENKLILLEEMKEEISFKDKLKALFRSFCPLKCVLGQLDLDAVEEEDTAVILFTSGTESLPKGVPLSHKNILSNQRAAFSCVSVKNSDVLYSVLPPFHSLGFSITGLLPILSGWKVYYYVNPSDPHALLHDIERVKPTYFICAPSFIRALFAIAKPEELSSLKVIVSGAEKTPKELFNYVQEHLPHAEIIEGYGITECSPVVTLNLPGKKAHGIGKPLPGVDLAILDLATGEFFEGEGEICIHGPGVFKKYLGSNRDPFIERLGKKWYRSGDLGSIDKEGYVHLGGRISRFVKIGGEMISLSGLEEDLMAFVEQSHVHTEGPPLAVVVKEKDADKPELFLFTSFQTTKEEVNAFLKASGWGRIVKISSVQVLDKLPLTGTGKIHYRLLEEKIRQ